MPDRKTIEADTKVNYLSNESIKAFRLRSSKSSTSTTGTKPAQHSTVVEQKITVSPLPSDDTSRVKAEINFALVAGDLLEVTAIYYLEIDSPTAFESTTDRIPADEVLARIGLNSIVSIAWPYWRLHISRLLIDFCLPPINLPLFLPIDLTKQHLQSPPAGKTSVKKNPSKRTRSAKN